MADGIRKVRNGILRLPEFGRSLRTLHAARVIGDANAIRSAAAAVISQSRGIVSAVCVVVGAVTDSETVRLMTNLCGTITGAIGFLAGDPVSIAKTAASFAAFLVEAVADIDRLHDTETAMRACYPNCNRVIDQVVQETLCAP